MDHVANCPFCGSSDVGVQQLAFDSLVAKASSDRRYAAVCVSCGCRGPAVVLKNYPHQEPNATGGPTPDDPVKLRARYEAVEEAANFWNRRV